MTEEEYRRGLVNTYCWAWRRGWEAHPPGLGQRSDPREHDAPNYQRMRQDILSWAEDEHDLSKIPYGELVKLVEGEIELVKNHHR